MAVPGIFNLNQSTTIAGYEVRPEAKKVLTTAIAVALIGFGLFKLHQSMQQSITPAPVPTPTPNPVPVDPINPPTPCPDLSGSYTVDIVNGNMVHIKELDTWVEIDTKLPLKEGMAFNIVPTDAGQVQVSLINPCDPKSLIIAKGKFLPGGIGMSHVSSVTRTNNGWVIQLANGKRYTTLQPRLSMWKSTDQVIAFTGQDGRIQLINISRSSEAGFATA